MPTSSRLIVSAAFHSVAVRCIGIVQSQRPCWYCALWVLCAGIPARCSSRLSLQQSRPYTSFGSQHTSGASMRCTFAQFLRAHSTWLCNARVPACSITSCQQHTACWSFLLPICQFGALHLTALIWLWCCCRLCLRHGEQYQQFLKRVPQLVPSFAPRERDLGCTATLLTDLDGARHTEEVLDGRPRLQLLIVSEGVQPEEGPQTVERWDPWFTQLHTGSWRMYYLKQRSRSSQFWSREL